MARAVRTRYVTECFWAGVEESDLCGLDQRVETSMGVVVGDGQRVRYLGRLLVIDDEVVLVLFEGPLDVVRRVAEHAQIPFGRILRAEYTPWPPNPTPNQEVRA